MFNKKINREKLVKKIEYQESRKREKYDSINDFILEEIAVIKAEINKHVCDQREEVILSDRQAWCREEFDKYISQNNFEQAFYDLYEFIDSYRKSTSIREKERGYIYSKIITKYEVDIIIYMMQKLEEGIGKYKQKG